MSVLSPLEVVGVVALVVDFVAGLRVVVLALRGFSVTVEGFGAPVVEFPVESGDASGEFPTSGSLPSGVYESAPPHGNGLNLL